MKRTLVAVVLFCIVIAGFTSCTTQKGCKATQGYVGYGSRH